MIINILFLVLLGCKSKDNTLKNSIPAGNNLQSIVDSFPVTKKEMSVIYPYSFKKYTGRIMDRDITLFLVKGNFVYNLYRGFYFFEDEKIPRFLEGEQYIQHSDKSSHVSDLPGEIDHTSRDYEYAVVRLKDFLTSYLSSDNKDYGFRGWITDSFFISYISHPYFNKGECYNFGDFYNMNNCTKLKFKEAKSNFSFLSKTILLKIDDDNIQKGNANNYNIVINSNLVFPQNRDIVKQIFIRIPEKLF